MNMALTKQTHTTVIQTCTWTESTSYRCVDRTITNAKKVIMY